MKNVAIVTVNYNTADDTKVFLKSLKQLKTQGVSVEVIVVDNGSEKPLSLEAKEHTHLIRLEENTGFTGGYNAGIRQALKRNADYIMVVNNDTTVDPDLIQSLITVLDCDPKIGVVVPKIYFAKGHEFHKDRYTKDELGKVFWYAGGSIDWKNAMSIHRGVDEVDHGQYDAPEEISFATGCCMMFKKEVLQEIGLFDDRYFLYFEDADMSERIRLAGYKIYYAPRGILYHVNASSSGGAGKGNVLQDYFITRNQMLFGMMYAPLRTKIALIRQSLQLSLNGRPKQKQAIRDFYFARFGKGTFFKE